MTYLIIKKRHQGGFSLVELMVGLMVGLIVIAGIGAVYILSRSSFTYQRELSAMQESARNISYAIVSDLKTSGFNICGNAGEYSNKLAANNGAWMPGSWASSARFPVWGIVGDANGWSGAINAVPGSDVLLIESVDRNSGVTVINHNATAGSIQISSTDGIVAGQLLLLTDCRQTTLMVVSGVAGNTVSYQVGGSVTNVCSSGLAGTCGNPDFYTFRPGSTAYAVKGVSYVAGQTSDYGWDNKRVLWRVDWPTGNAPAPMLAATNVESLGITYGVDSDGDGAPDQYLAANLLGLPDAAGNQWRNVVSARVAILLVSDRNNVVPAPQTYVFNGTSVTATDRRLYFPYETTVYLRNQFY